MSTQKNKSKLVEIMSCLCEPEVDLWYLRELCLTEGGLLHDGIRRNAWPKLLGIKGIDGLSFDFNSEQSIPTNTLPQSDINQINADVERSQCQLIISQHDLDNCSDDQRQTFDRKVKKRQSRLGCLIKSALEIHNEEESISEVEYEEAISTAYKRLGIEREGFSRYSQTNNKETFQDVQLRYYQGFHDIASVVQGVMYVSRDSHSFNKAVVLLHRIAKCYLRDALREDFTEVIHLLKLSLFPLISELGDFGFYDYLIKSRQEPYFALPWIITWFSHDIRDTSTAKRIFDACLASHPLLPIYLAVAMVLHPYNRRIVFKKEDNDFASVHRRLCSLPENSCPSASNELDEVPVPFQSLIDNAITYMRRVPPRNLLKLATSYRNGELSSTISRANPSLLFPPERWRNWAFTSTIPSDWIIQQRKSNGSIHDVICDEEDISKDKKLIVSSIAWVASGLSKGENDKSSRLLIGGVAAAVISVGLYMINNDHGSVEDKLIELGSEST